MTPPNQLPRRAALHIFALVSLAIAQPLFDLLGKNAEFFVAGRTSSVELVFLVVAVVLGIPAGLVLCRIAAGLLGEATKAHVHLATIGMLLSILTVQVGRVAGLQTPVILMLATSAGVAGAALYRRVEGLRQFLSFLSVAVVIVPANFLLNSDARKVLSATDAPSIRSHVASDTPVLLLIFDELPLASLLDEQLRIDVARYPNFAQLTSTAYWFRNATSVADGTNYAVPAILTGRYPKKGLLPTAADLPDNLFTLLGGGYQITSHESITRLCPADLCSNDLRHHRGGMGNLLVDAGIVLGHVLLPPDLAVSLLPSIQHSWSNFRGEPAAPSGHATDDGAGIRPELRVPVTSARRALYALHYLLPHVPWQFLPNGKRYDLNSPLPGLGLGERWSSDTAAVTQGYARHLLQVGYADFVLGKILDKFKAAGIFDDALIVVVADHGCTFRPGANRRVLTSDSWPEVLRVPMIVKLPGQKHGVLSDTPVETVDIVPTIADVVGAAVPFNVDGKSIVGSTQEIARERRAFNYHFDRFLVPNDLSGLDALVKRKAELFGTGADRRRLFGYGPAWRVIGEPIEAWRLSAAEPVPAVLTTPEQFANVEPDREFLPALVSGRLLARDLDVSDMAAAIAVNGRIWTVSPLSRSGQDAVFEGIVPSVAFQRGRNDVAIYLMNFADLQSPLGRTRLIGGEYRLISVTGSEKLSTPFGKSIRPRPGEVAGAVEEASLTNLGGYLSIGGWVVDPAHAGVPAVLVFADGRFVGSATPGIERPDVVKRIKGTGALRSGYIIRIPRSELEGARSVRLFGLSADGRASELQYPPEGFRWR